MMLRYVQPLAVAMAAMLCVVSPSTGDTPSHDAFTYQGQLSHNGEPVAGPVNFAFRLYDADLGGEQVGPEIEALGFDGFDDDGRFTLDLAFGKGVFDGTPLWLEVRVNGGPLLPRQPIMPAPYSIRSLNVASVADGAFGGTYSQAVTLNNAANQFSGAFAGSGAGLTSLNASNIATGTLGASLLSGNYTNALTFNNPGNQFTGAFAGSGAGLTSLNASNIAIGNLNINRMPSGGNWNLSSNLNIGGNALLVNPATNRVGIGTASPSRTLTVNGDGRITGEFEVGDTSGFFLDASVHVGAVDRRAVYLRSNYTSPDDLQVVGELVRWTPGTSANGIGGRLLWSIKAPNNAHSNAGAVDVSIADWNSSLANMVFRVRNASGLVEQMRLTGNGRVGIGTNNPEARLHLFDSGSDVGMKLRAGGSWTAEIQQTNSSYFNILNGGQVRMTVRAGGQVGIGTEEPGSFLLAVNGSAAKPGGGSWSVFSDARLKRDVQPLEPGTLDRLLALSGYTFEYEDHAIENRLALPGRQIGLIAQEVQSVFPDWVDADEEGYLYITERGSTALFVEALRELREEKDAQVQALREEKDAEIAALLEEMQQLRDLVRQLATRNQESMQ